MASIALREGSGVRLAILQFGKKEQGKLFRDAVSKLQLK